MTLCKAMSSDGDNGKRNYAFSSWDPANFLTANGTYYVKTGEDGKTVLNLDDPKMSEALTYFQGSVLYGQGLHLLAGLVLQRFPGGQSAHDDGALRQQDRQRGIQL